MMAARRLTGWCCLEFGAWVVVSSVGWGGLQAAQAQAEPTPEPAPTGVSQLSEIVVTATRTGRLGYKAPTPMTVVDAQSITQQAQTTVTQVLQDLPQFRGTMTPTTRGPGTNSSLANADLRGLGPVRTLVLVDGRRVVPSTNTGLTDLNLVPSLLIDHIDVVTGGASADWGSDAVAGVVNIIQKTSLDGVQGDVMGGISSYSDNREARVSIAAGKPLFGGRLRDVVAFDYDDNHGVGPQSERPWGRSWDAVYANPCAGVAGTPLPASAGCAGNTANGLPQRLILPNVYVTTGTTGGLITGVSGASTSLRGLAFGSSGTPFAFPYGALTSSTQTVESGVTPGAYPGGPALLNLENPDRRYNGSMRAAYDFSDHVSGFVQVLTAHTRSFGSIYPNSNTLTIQSDNAFLPASVAASMPAGSTIKLGRWYNDGADNPVGYTTNFTYNATAGLDGDLFRDWSWHLDGSFGRNRLHEDNTGQLITANLTQAVDAVLSPAGQIVCRSTLTNPSNGCVPFDPFGQGAPSAAAQAYAGGTATYNQVTKQTEMSGTLRGEPFSTWAGRVSLVGGGEYRKEQVDTDVDSLSLANAFLSNPANQKPLHGAYHATEGFTETVIPLLHDQRLAKSLDFNGAVRETSYSQAGRTTTWKLGLTYQPNPELLFRGTRSRDLRAPNLNELFAFAVPSLPNTLTNPWLGGVNAGLVPTFTSGNPKLLPEVGKTSTYGVTYQPHWATGLALSVDYYDIKLDGAISTISNQTIINECYNGLAAACSLVVRNASNQITTLYNQAINLASYSTRGLDLDASYQMNLSDLNKALRGTFSMHALATHVISTIVNDGVNPPVDRAGEVGTDDTFSMPHWSGTLVASYALHPFRLGAQVRLIGAGNFDNTYATGVTGKPGPNGFTINKNHVPAYGYLSLNAAYDLGPSVQLYGVVDNVLDTAPPAVPAGGGSTNPVLYDVIGRTFKIGARLSY